MLLRRLIAKGYIRIEQLNRRKVRYLLTPKGFAEKMRKSVKYTLKSLNSITLIKERLKKIIAGLYTRGERRFFILGRSDLAVLVESAILETHFDDISIRHIDALSGASPDGVVLICREEVTPDKGKNGGCVNMIEELAKDHEFLLLDRINRN